MPGMFTLCLADFVTETFGAATWDEIVTHAQVPNGVSPHLHIAMADADDLDVLALIDATRSVLGLTLQEAADSFGEYWSCIYAPEVAATVWRTFGSARECIERLDDLRPGLDATVPSPFRYDWQDERTLMVAYTSDRGLLDFYVGIVKGVGTAFDEPLRVRKLSSSGVEVVFA